MQRLAAFHRLDSEGWARHANPWSGYSRMFTGLPLLILAVWSRVWIGWWALAAVALVGLWLLLNPRLFPPPRDDRAWVSRAVFGEQFWIEKPRSAARFLTPTLPHILNGAAGLGLVPLIYGLATLHSAATVIGASIAFGGKMLFLEQMVRLYDRASRHDPALRYAPARASDIGRG